MTHHDDVGHATVNEHRSNFMMWAIAKAPLLLSTNVTALGLEYPALMALLLNKEVIAINQDSNGVQARKLMADGAVLGKLVGVEECARPDMMALSASTLQSPAPFRSFSEAEAGKQLWETVDVTVEVPTAAPPTKADEDTVGSGIVGDASVGGDGGGGGGAVLLKNRFYSDRCLALQPPNPIAYNPPYRHPTRPNPRPVWSSDWQAVLLPCDPASHMQQWLFAAPGQYPSEKASKFARRTLSALLNVGATADARAGGGSNPSPKNPFNSTVPPNASSITLSLLPETDTKYGVNHVGAAPLEYLDVEVACTTRGCTQYQPSQMWYLDGYTGQLQSGNYTASINEQWLTSMVPAPSRRCLAAVHSADMAGTPAGSRTEVWGGPLSNGRYVVALSNRDGPDSAAVELNVAALVGSNIFFSFAMLAEPAARAAGYAKSVQPPPLLPPTTRYTVRDVLAGVDLPGTVDGRGKLSANVDTGDTRLFVLTPEQDY